MIKNKKPNPLNVYNLEDSLDKWISNNLRNRYYIGREVTLDHNNKINQVITVGFEETRDLSYFMLACPHLKYT